MSTARAAELEYFEYVAATEDHALLRVGGSGVRSPAALLIDDGRRVYRRAPLAKAAPAQTEADWHCAFAVPRRWLGSGQARWALDAGEVLELPQPVERKPARAAARRGAPARRQPRLGGRSTAFAVAIAAAVGAVGVAVAGGMSPERGDPTAGSRPVELRALPAAQPGVRGQVSWAGERTLRLKAAGLRRGRRYSAWLYDDARNAVALGSFRGPAATVFLRVPNEAASRAFLDVSIQAGLRGSHSGRSVLRVPTSGLRKG